jgi:hypothetical protein
MGRSRLGKTRWGLVLLATVAAALPATVTFAGGGGGSACTKKCLTFVTEPGSVTDGSSITSGAFGGGSAVQVEATNEGKPVGGLEITLSAVGLTGATDSLYPPTASEPTDSSGIADFAGLAIASPVAAGYFELAAVAARGGYSSPHSSSFLVVGTVETPQQAGCSGTTQSCSFSLQVTSQSDLGLGSVTGNPNDAMTMSAGGFSTYNCLAFGYFGDGISTKTAKKLGLTTDPIAPVEADLWTLDGNPATGTKQITIEVYAATVHLVPNNGAAHFQICAAATSTLQMPKSGCPWGPTATGQCAAINVGQTTFYYGLLPDCSPTLSVGCVVSRNKDSGGNVLITFVAPLGDFWGSA